MVIYSSIHLHCAEWSGTLVKRQRHTSIFSRLYVKVTLWVLRFYLFLNVNVKWYNRMSTSNDDVNCQIDTKVYPYKFEFVEVWLIWLIKFRCFPAEILQVHWTETYCVLQASLFKCLWILVLGGGFLPSYKKFCEFGLRVFLWCRDFYYKPTAYVLFFLIFRRNSSMLGLGEFSLRDSF